MLLYYTQVDKSEVTDSFLRDYLSFKEEMSDGVLLYDMGTFYDAYFDDARVVASLTDLTLSTRKLKKLNECYHQTGVPKNNTEVHLKKILDENINVYICDIPEEEKNKKRKKNEYAPRIFSRKYTPGTITETELLNANENNYIMALYCKNNIYYISYADVSTGQFYKTSGSLKQIEFEVEKIDPRELLISEKQTFLFKKLNTEEYFIKTLKEEEFEDCKVEDVILKYCEKNQGKYFAVLDKIVEYKMETFLMLDNITRRTLELSRTRRKLKKQGSLLWLLNYTKTPMGSRHLKRVLSEPLLDVNIIKERQKAVSEFIKNEPLFMTFEEKLENFCDLARICTKISNSTIDVKEFNAIVNCSDNIKSLYYLSKSLSSDLLHLNKETLNAILSVAKKIKIAVYKENPVEISKYGYINKGYDDHLDYDKKLLKEKEEEIDYLEKKLQKRLELQDLKIILYENIGYCIEIPKAKAKHMSGSDFTFKHGTSTCFRYTHKDLQIYEQEINNLRFQIQTREKKLLNELKLFAKNFVDSIRRLSHDIAKIDVLASFARCSLNNNLTKPKFNDKVFEAINAFHPSLLKLNNEIIKNDIFMENDSMAILTGANMSGKSTFLKCSAIITILAQIGCFVPADSSNLTIVDRIFLRQGSTDDIIANNSSFMVEMNDLQFIIDNATNRSLILLDEPAKSTEAKESGAIVKAFCEYILNHYKSKAIIVTHNIDVTKLENQYPDKVINYKIGSHQEGSINDRKIRRGIAESSEAINTAILAGLPDEIIKSAKTYLN